MKKEEKLEKDKLAKKQLETYYTYAGKGVCVECEQYGELFVYRAKNTLLFEGDKNIYWDLKNKEVSERLRNAFVVNGKHLNIFLNTPNDGRKKTLIEEVGYSMFILRNPVVAPSDTFSYELFYIKTDFKTAKIYKHEEQTFCGNCISTTIQTHLDRSVKWEAKAQ